MFLTFSVFKKQTLDRFADITSQCFFFQILAKNKFKNDAIGSAKTAFENNNLKYILNMSLMLFYSIF
jgi:hypothetical protein